MTSNLNNIKKEQKEENENTSPSFLSTRKLQSLSKNQGFTSKLELQRAVNEYCRDPDDWVNNVQYATYGYVIFLPTQT